MVYSMTLRELQLMAPTNCTAAVLLNKHLVVDILVDAIHSLEFRFPLEL
jgi:hypothetical protein